MGSNMEVAPAEPSTLQAKMRQGGEFFSDLRDTTADLFFGCTRVLRAAESEESIPRVSRIYDPDDAAQKGRGTRTSGVASQVTHGRRTSFINHVQTYTPVVPTGGSGKKSKMSTNSSKFGRTTLGGLANRFSREQVSVIQTSTRTSVAVVECPIPSLMGKSSRESLSDTEKGGSVRPEVRASIAIDVGRNASVSALEVLPASPEREKLIEIYCVTGATIENAENFSHLVKFMEEAEKEAIIICATQTPIDPKTLKKLRVSATFTPDLDEKFKVFNKHINVVGLAESENYLSSAVDKIHKVKKEQRERQAANTTSPTSGGATSTSPASCSAGAGCITICVTDCQMNHCKSLVDDLNGINVMVRVGDHKENHVIKPRGVPIVEMDSKTVAHITVGFDEYDQYEIRRTEFIEYDAYLKDLGLLDFLEDEEEEDEDEHNPFGY